MTAKSVSLTDEHDLLKEQMTAVLASRRQLRKQLVTLEERRQETHALQQALDDIAIPSKPDEREVSACVEALESVAHRLVVAEAVCNEQRRQCNETMNSLIAQNAELLRIASSSSLAHNDDLLREAAISLAQRSSKEALMDSLYHVREPQTEQTIDADTLDALRQSIHRSVGLCAAIIELLPAMDALESKFEHWHTDDNCRTREPARPIEEEVQRYLTGLQDKLQQRFQTDCQLISMLRKVEGLQLEAASTLGVAWEMRHKLPGSSVERRTFEAITGRLRSLAKVHLKCKIDNFRPSFPSAVDRSVSKSVGRQDQKDIDRLHKLMREAAFAMGAFNEADRNLDALGYIPRSGAMPRSPEPMVNEPLTWEDCLDWAAADARSKEKARQELLSLTTKKELIEQARAEAFKKRKKCVERLKQCNREILSRSGNIRCDELRHAMNIAALMYASYSTFDEMPAFPILWTKEQGT